MGRHMATQQYIVAPELRVWSWGVQVGVVPNVHKEGVSGPLIPVNKCRQIN